MKRIFLSIALLAILISPAFAQEEEKLTTADAMSVVLGHNPPGMTERLVPQNMVNITARHCQKYAKKHGFFHKHIVVNIEACDADPSTIFYSETNHNLRTTAGGDWQAAQMGGTTGAVANYIGLASDSSNSGAGTVAAGDTTLASSGTGSTEISSNGLSRASSTYAHTAGTSSYTMTHVFTATGTQASNKAGMFNASSSGTMAFENLYTAVTCNSGDTLTTTWTVNY
jgi:hypothetical protein